MINKGHGLALRRGLSVALFLCLSPALWPPDSASCQSPYSRLWAGFSTWLGDRSEEQRYNIERAALELDGAIIPSGSVFSFNQVVGERTASRGYLLAPAINHFGLPEETRGGGICQLATTLYNAALEAGLEVLERHRHSRAVGYAPPGRDATVWFGKRDLRFRNPYPRPLLVKARVEGDRLTVGFWAAEERTFRVEINTHILPVEPETYVAAGCAGDIPIEQAGEIGFLATTERIIFHKGQRVAREVISQDFYPPPSKIVAPHRGERER